MRVRARLVVPDPSRTFFDVISNSGGRRLEVDVLTVGGWRRGIGLVRAKTLGDFGYDGEDLTHPAWSFGVDFHLSLSLARRVV